MAHASAELADDARWHVATSYKDELDSAPRGFHAVHTSTGFVLDVLFKSDVPQALLWANTPPENHRGDAHTCEHLLLGKGDRGRAVATLEEVARVQSTAWTGRLRTVYAFQCTAGASTFFRLLEAKLAALLAPDATDEEIRREVCHVGPFVQDSGAILLEEKGCVPCLSPRLPSLTPPRCAALCTRRCAAHTRSPTTQPTW